MKLKQLSMLLFAAIVIFTGCKKDEEKVLDPTIDLIAGGSGYYVADDSVSVGDSVRIIFQATKGKDGAKLKEYKVVATTSANSVALTQVASNQEETFKYTYRALIITAETITFTVTDKDGKTASKSIKIKIKGGASVTPPTEQTSRSFNHMAAYDFEGLSSSVIAPSNPADFDLYFFGSGASGGNFVASGSQNHDSLYTYKSTWAGSSNIQIKTTTADYNAAKTADKSGLLTIFNEGTLVSAAPGLSAGVRVSNLAAGQLYIIRTSSGKYALVKVTNVNVTSPTSSSTVTIDYLID